MYYITIKHCVPYDTLEYETQKFFISQESAERYIQEIFNPYLYKQDSCYIISKGKANWTDSGILTESVK